MRGLIGASDNFIVIGNRGLRVASSAPSGAAPSYWLTFDGTNDFVNLPAGEGDVPSTAIFVEFWWTIANLTGGSRCPMHCGTAYNQGYSSRMEYSAGIPNQLSWYVYLNGPTGSGQVNLANAWYADTYPIHLAYGWDGSYIYRFINGVLVSRVESSNTPLAYTGTAWEIGRLDVDNWKLDGKLSLVRVSNVCRYTASFTPPTTLATDANTVGLWLAREGAGTSLGDSSGNARNGTFKGAGEPAWGTMFSANLETQVKGATLWTNCLAAVPAITDTNIYVHRTGANGYEVYRKVHATGPYWAKMGYNRDDGGAALNLKGAFTGIPDPASDDPTTWTTGPTTDEHSHNPSGAITSHEYAFNVEGTWHGNGHLNETLVSEGWTIDGVAWNPSNDQWGNGATVVYTATTTWANGADVRATLVKTMTWDKSKMYMESVNTITWARNIAAINQSYPAMFDMNATNLSSANLESAGTDYATAGADTSIGEERSRAIALWNAANGMITAVSVATLASLKYQAQCQRAFINQATSKAYISRSAELLIPSGQTWSWTSRWLFLDNCGNHFLKTT